MKKIIIAIVLSVIIVVSCSVNVLLYLQNQSIARSNSDMTLFKQEFGNVAVLTRSAYDFSPPVSMYRAIKIGLESDGWNATALQDMAISAYLDYSEFQHTASNDTFKILFEVTNPMIDYSSVQRGDTTYRYIWLITVNKIENLGLIHSPPEAFYCIDVMTAELIPHGSLFL